MKECLSVRATQQLRQKFHYSLTMRFAKLPCGVTMFVPYIVVETFHVSWVRFVYAALLCVRY